MKVSSFILASAALLSPVFGLGQNATITTTAGSSTLLQLAGSGTPGQILLSSNEWWGVLRAAQDLAIDFGKVTGKNLTLGNWGGNSTKRDAPLKVSNSLHDVAVTNGATTTVYYTFQATTNNVNYTVGPIQNFTGPTLTSNAAGKVVVIAGTIGNSAVIDQLVSSGKLDVSAIKGQWESFISVVISSPLPGVDRAMVIAGSDQRGTIFGLYDVSEQIGVSPWYWFADVPVKKSKSVWALGVKKIQGPPSIKYRGIFINDEQPSLTNWINANYAPGPWGAGFNHYFYPRVFELLLRLRANYLWPAIWGSMFNVDDTLNQPLADAFAIVMGTSHTEPMMRATNEWSNFGAKYGGDGQWAFTSNNASIKEFFTYGIQRTKPYIGNSLITMATRGLGDTAVTLTDAQAVASLEQVVKAQRDILTAQFPGVDITTIPQMWCLYKEVQGYYEQEGLTVPDDITLLWADDNWGNVRRLPIASEYNRTGGAGVYYHVDYVGDPRNYKWINTIQLSKTVEQMTLAYQRQANRIWILNVGDLKPLEIPINHFLDMAYNTPQWGYDSVPVWLEAWANREFGSHATEIASIMERYGMYAARRKYEVLDLPNLYSLINYNEVDAILAQWQQLADDAQNVYDDLGHDYKAAFYEMILQPCLGGQVVQQIYLGTTRNSLYTSQKRNTANDVADNIRDLFTEDHKLTQRYHELLDGKWNHILDQTHLGYAGYWQQPMRNALPPLNYVQTLETSVAGNIGIGVEASNATVSGDDMYHGNSGNTLVLPPMDPYGPKTRWIDVFARGTAACSWTLSPWAPYVKLSSTSGTTGGNNGTDTRVYVSIDWSLAPAAPNATTVNINVTSSCGSAWGNYPSPMVQVPVQSTTVPADFVGFVESDKHISIEAEHTSRSTAVNGVSYMTLPSHGRTLSGVTLTPVLTPSQPAGTGPVLEYDIFTFSNQTLANVTLLLSPSLNQQGASHPLKYGVAFDAETPQTIQFVGNYTGGAYPPGWLGAVADNTWGLATSGKTTTTTHNLAVTGKHTLKVWAVEAGVVIQKIIIDLGGVRYSYLGPPESFRAGNDTVGAYEGLNFAGIAT